MGNVEGKATGGRRRVDPPYCTARPLPPLPNDDEEEDLDLDSPPPYPPPPPPSEERSKRYSWRMSDSAVFGQGENKRRSWLLNLTNGGDKTKSKMAKDGKDVDDVNSKISVGSMDVSGGVGVKASFNEPHINIQENSWTVEGKPDANQTTGKETHVFTYNISDKEKSMQGEKVIKMKTEYVRGEDSSAPGYSVLHECLQHDMNSEGRMIHDQNNTQLPSLDLSCTSNMSDELKNVIDELRGKPSTEDSTVFKTVSEHRRFVSITTTTKKEVSSHININGKEYSSTTNDSLSKLEAELSALLSPELELHTNSETVNSKNTSVSMRMENGHGSGANVGLGSSTSQAHSSQVNQSYNISVTPTLPLPDIQEFSGKGIPLLPDLVKGNNKGAITVESSLQGRDKNVNVGAGGSITGPTCDVQLDKRGDFGGGRLDAKFDSSLPQGKGEIDGLHIGGDMSGPRLDVSAEGNKFHTPGVALAGEVLPRGDVSMSVEPGIPVTPDIGKPATKSKKQSSGPCACLSSPKKIEQEEPYISVGVQGEGKGELPSVSAGSVEVEGVDSGLRTEGTATAKIPQKKRSGPKSKLGSCFGKPKASEFDTPEADIKGEVEMMNPRPTAEPRAEASVNIQVPDENVKIGKDPEKKKTKFGSCFGKPKEPEYDVKGESYRVISDEPEFEGKLDVGAVSQTSVPQVSVATTTGDISFQTKSTNVSPSLKCDIPDFPKVEANVETRAGVTGDVEGGFSGDIHKGGDVQIQANVPKIDGKIASKEYTADSDISLIPGNMDINIPGFKFSQSTPEATIEGSSRANFNSDISLDIEGKAPDAKIKGEMPGLSLEGNLPSMYASGEKTNIKYSEDTPEVKIEGKLPESKGDFNADLGIDLPHVAGTEKELEIRAAGVSGVTVKSDLPAIDVPKGEVSIPSSPIKPSVGIKAEVKGPKGSTSLDVPSVKPKTKKAKLGPCACLGKSGKMDIEEPYIEKEGEVSGRFENVDADIGVKVEGPRVEGPEAQIAVGVESPETESRKAKVSGKPKMSLGSCFGKAKPPSAPGTVSADAGVEGNISAEPHIKVKGADVEGPSADISIPRGKAEIDIESPEVKAKGGKVAGKPKMKFGPCFGKGKSKGKDVEAESEYKIEGPSVSGEISPSSPELRADVSVDSPKAKIKGEKPKTKLGSCFGKPKEPKVEGEYQAGKIAVESPEVTSKVEIPSGEASVAPPAVSVDISAESPEAKIKGEKPKSKLGSCFGKPKGPKVEGEYEPAKVQAESSGASGEIKVTSPEIRGDISAEAPKVEIKGEKPKSRLGSCFGEPKGPDAEGEYKPSKLEVEGPSVTGEASAASPEISGDVSAELPRGEVKGGKPKSKLGSCFGKPKEPKVAGEYKPAKVNIDEPSISGEASVKSPELAGDIGIKSPKLSGDASIKHPDAEMKGKKPKSKFGSCFGKSKSPEIEGKVEAETPEISGEVDISSPELKGGVSIEPPDVRIKGEKPKSKLGSCFGKPNTPQVEGEYMVSTERPEAEAGVSVRSIKGDVDPASPEIKVKGSKPKSKLGSCFGKPESGKIEGEYKPGSVDIEGPDVSAGASVKPPVVGGEIDIDSPEVEVKSKKVSGKPKAKLGSCFGKPKEPKVKGEIDIEGPSVEGELPTGKAEVDVKAPEMKVKSKKVKGKSAPLCASCIGKASPPDVDIDADVEPASINIHPEKPSMEGKISVEGPSIDVKPVKVKVKGPSMPEVPELKGNLDVEADIPDFEPSIKIKGDIPDIPKVEAEIGGKADIPEIEIKGNVPALPKIEASVDAPELKVEGELPKLKTEGDIDIGINVPSISGDIKGLDIETPDFPSGKIEGDIKGDLPSIEIPKAEVSLPAGPELPSAEIKGELKGPEISGSAQIPKAELKTKKAKLGPCACLGKSGKIGKEEPYMAAEAGGKMSGEVEGIDVGVEGPKGSVAVDVESPEIKGKKVKASGKPKMSLGSCFGKAKPPSAHGDVSADVGVEGTISAEPHIKVEGADIAGPSADISLPEGKAEVDIDSPDVKVKGGKVSGKPKMKFGPCFGKGKDVEVEGEYKPSKVEVKGPSVSGEVSASSPEVSGDISVESPKAKIKGEKPKSKLGSCFGKPKGPKLEGEYKPAKVSGEGPEVSGEISVASPDISAEISAEPPKAKLKGEKPKSKLGSCFGKPKGPKVEGEYKPSRVDVEYPEVSSEAEVPSAEVKGSIKVDSPDVRFKEGKPKSKFGSCFGKPKSPEIEGEYKPGKISIEGPEAEAGVSARSPAIKGDVDLESPEIKVKGSKPKSKLGSCFGKPKSGKIEGEYKPGSVDIEGPGVSAGAKVKGPDIEGEIDIDSPEVEVKGKKVSGKPKAKLGSCFGKSKEPKVKGEIDIEGPRVEGEVPTGKAEVDVKAPEMKVKSKKVKGKSAPLCASCIGKASPPDVDIDADVEPASINIHPEKPSMEGKISVEGPSIDVEPVKVKVKGPSMPEVPELKGNLDVEADIPDFEPSIKIKGDIPDIPKVEAEIGGKADIPEIEIKGNVPALPKIEASVDAPELKVEGELPKLKTEGDIDIGINVPSISGDIKGLNIETPDFPSGKIEGDIKGDLPSIEIPKAEVSLPAGPELPSAEIKGELKGPEISGSAQIPKAELKTKKAKLGPCACLGKSGKIGKEEPYMAAEAGGKMSGEVEGVDVGVEGPKGSVAVDVESPEIKGKKVKASGKPKMSLGSCFGKAKPPSAHGDVSADVGVEGTISAEPHIKVEGADIAGPSADISLPEGKAEVDIDSPDVKVKGGKVSGKPKMKFGPCFGKGKDVEVEGEYKPSKVEVKGPSVSGEVSASSPELSGDISVESPKAKIKGEKPKTKLGSCFGKPKGPEVEGEYDPAKLDVEGPEVRGEVGVPSAEVTGDINVESPDVKVKAGKPKAKIGSCFGKPKSPEVEGEYKPGKISVEGPEAEAGVSTRSPAIKGDVDLESPEIKVKGSKPKSKLGSCFGKPKSGKIEGEYKPGSVDIEGPGVSAGAKVKSPDIEGEIDIDAPEVEVKGKKVSGKPKAKLGSCFGKPKEPKVKGEIDIEGPSVEGELPTGKAEVDVKAPEMKVKSKKVKGKSAPLCASCIGKASPPDVDIDADVEPASINIHPEKPSMEGKISVEGPSIDVEPVKVKVKGPSIPEVPEMKGNLDMEAEIPDFEPSIKIKGDIPDIPKVEAEIGGKADIPEIEIKGNVPALPKIEASVDAPELKVEGELPKLKTEGDIDIGINVPSISGDIKGLNIETPDFPSGKIEGDIKGDLPSIEIPKAEVSLPAGPELPSAEIKGELKGPEISGSAQIPKAELKTKKAKLGPCACLGKSGKIGKEEPYMAAEAGGKMSGDVEGVDVGVEGPKGSVAVDVESPEIKGKKVKASGKPKMSLGSCFGKAKPPSAHGDVSADVGVEGTISAEPHIKVEGADIAGPSADISLPEGKAEVDIDSPDVKVKGGKVSGKPKMKFGPCFGKGKDVEVEGEYKPSKVEVKGPSVSGEVSASSPEVSGDISVESPKAKIKGEKPKTKLGSCFGKPKGPEVEGEYDTAKLDVEGPEVRGEVGVPSAEVTGDINVESPDVKVKAGKPKAKLGSCFGKPKSPEVEGEYKPGIDVEGHKAGAEVSARAPEVEGHIDVDSPDIKIKRGKPKSRLGPCFGKAKGEVEGEYKPGSVSVKGPDVGAGASVTSPDISAEASLPTHDPGAGVSLKSPDIEGEIDIEKPKVEVKDKKVSGKPKVNLGSCFGKPKEPKIEVDIEGTGAQIQGEVPAAKAEVDVKAPEGKVKGKKAKGKSAPLCTSCIGKASPPDVDIEADVKPGIVKISPEKPSIEGKVSVDAPDVTVEPSVKVVGPSVPRLPEVRGDLEVKIDEPDVEPSLEIKGDIPDIPKVKAEIGGKADIPGIEMQGSVPKLPEVKATIGSPEWKTEGDVGVGVSAPSISGDIKGDLPIVEVTVPSGPALPSTEIKGEVKSPALSGSAEIPKAELKTKKPKLGPCACLGKSGKEEPYIAAEVGGKVSGEVEGVDAGIERPKGSIAVEVDSPEIKNKKVKASGKPKMSLGSCFGKGKPPSVSGEISTGLDVDVKPDQPDFEISAEAPVPPMRKGKKIKVKSPDVDMNMGSVNVNADVPEVGGIDVSGIGIKAGGPDINGSVDIPEFEGCMKSPHVKGSIEIPKVEGKIDMPEITGSGEIQGYGGKITMPDIEGNTGVPGFSGKLSMPEVNGNVDIPSFGSKIDMPDLNGKVDIQGFRGKVDMPEIKGNVGMPSFGGKVDMPEIKGSADIPGFGSKVDMPEIKGSVGIPGFGGKVDMPDMEGTVDMPEIKGSVGIPGFGGKVDMPEIKGNVGIPGFGGKVDMPEIKGSVGIPGFGGKVDMPEMEGKVDMPEIKGSVGIPGFGGKVDMPEIKGSVGIPGFGGKVDMPEMEGKVDMPEIKGNVGIPGFGGKIDMPEVKGSVGIPGFGGKVDMPEMKGKVDMPEIKGNVGIPGFGGKIDMPEIKGSVGIPGFGGKIDMPEVKGKVDMPEIKGSVGIPGFGGKVDMPEMKGKIDMPEIKGKVDMPEIKGNVGIPGFGGKIDMPEVKGSVGIPGFGGKVDMPEIKGSVGIPGFGSKIDMPEVKGKVDMPEIKGSVGIPGFGGKVDMPEIKGSVGIPGFGGKIDMPEIKGKVDMPEIKGSVGIPGFGGKIDMPEVKGKVDMPEIKGSVGIPGFGGKADMPEIKGKVDMPEIKGSAGIPGFEGRVDLPDAKGKIKTSGFGGEIGVPEMKGKIEITGFGDEGDMPETLGTGVKVDLPLTEGKLEIQGPEGKICMPEIKGKTGKTSTESKIDMPVVKGKAKSRGKVNLPKGKGSAEISGIEGEVDIPLIKGNVKTPGFDGKVNLPKAKGKAVKADIQEKKASVDLPEAEGKMKTKVEIPNIKSGVVEDIENLEGVKVKTKISDHITKTETIAVDSEIRVPSLVTGNGDLSKVSSTSTVVTTDIPLTKSKKKRNRANRKKKANSMSEEELEKETDQPEAQTPYQPAQQQTSVSVIPKLQGTVEVSTSLPESKHGIATYTFSGSDRTVGDTMIEEYHSQHPVSSAMVVSTGEPTVVSSSAGAKIVSSRVSGEGELRGNIPEVSVRPGTVPIGWVIPPQTSHSTISHKVIVGDSNQFSQEFVVPHTQSITVLPQSQTEHSQVMMTSRPAEIHEVNREYTISTEAQRADDVESYIKGKLGPFRITPDRTLSECKTEVQVIREPFHISPDRTEQHQIHLSPDTSGDWSVGPYSYQVRMETDSEGKLISAPQLTELQSKEDGESRGSKQSRNVFVTEDAGGRVIVHRRIESQTVTSDQDGEPSGQRTQIVRQDPESSVVTRTEWPENITTHRTVRIRKIKRVRVGDGPEETTVETEYEGDPDALNLDSVEGFQSGLTHLLPGTSGESSLLRFGLGQRETPENTQTVTTTVRRVPADLSHFMQEGYDENLENILGSTTTTTTTRTVRKVKVIRRDEDGNIVEFEDEEGEVSSLPPALTSEDVSTTVSDDGTTTTTTRRIIRERRIITSDLTEDANRSTVRESASGEGEAGSSQDPSRATH
ncbi:neuroblast differentiation-associated protein AHNAK-like isoform X42 [Penaeus monodon]|uniref:neuroblast differentiation-associated protein AHNAK-like isoform X42 n=1 Tax=Penaeus monodon TaxID=6687 RepID=UPI0018A7D89F|nr:neuroblast differentiation-associated protein AHNAK-like isoform X42 [Penaeus monodon]